VDKWALAGDPPGRSHAAVHWRLWLKDRQRRAGGLGTSRPITRGALFPKDAPRVQATTPGVLREPASCMRDPEKDESCSHRGRWLLSTPPVYTCMLCRMPFIATSTLFSSRSPWADPSGLAPPCAPRSLETGGTGGTLWANSTDGCPCSIPGPSIKMVVVRCSSSSSGDRHRSV
jgi:hypothetical protein